MNCLPNISIALTLLSLIAGVWFLQKTQKENLGMLFKVAAWFVIIVALLNMACCGMRCMRHGCGEHRMRGHHGGECEMGGYERCGMRGGDYYNINAENCWMGDKESCKTECEEDENDDSKCCDKDKEECKIQKDSVAVKKGK
ncbi:MAG TPA: hypothetical protein VNX01_15990 [Bacteroidia bacterium]|jgi:hypothetical protein|nr:hypothetical protein [Bacteroidia bacterium]